MAPMMFDMRNSEVDKIHLTFGRSKHDTAWFDRREIAFSDFVTQLKSAPVGRKDGPCYTPAIFSGGRRLMDTAERIDVAVLDADCGHSFEEIERALMEKGWRAIVHSTYSHLTETTDVGAGAAEKWFAANPDGTIAEYMRVKGGYLHNIVEGAEIVEECTKADKRFITVHHAPCPKFRIILPLAEPWVAENFETQEHANAAWRNRIIALAAHLGLKHDQSCVDTSRLFYLPRLRAETQEYRSELIQGVDCPIWDLPDATPAIEAPLFDAAAKGGTARNVVVANFAPKDQKTYTSPHGEFINLTTWAAKFALRFEVVTALRERAPQIFSSRRSGVKHHIYCANSDSHITGGADGTGSFVVNASQVSAAGLTGRGSGFYIHCSHNGCQGLDRLDHVRAMLAQGSLEISDLTNPAYLVPEAEVDVSGMAPAGVVATIPSKAVAPLPAAPPPEANKGNIPAHLYTNLPGALGLMHDFMLATAIKPQPVLALGACLAFAAAAIGQRVMLDRWPVRPNIYVLGVARSATGKDRMISACKQMAHAAGLYSELIGVEEVASDAGIVSSVARAPHQMMLIDEVGYMLSAANSVKAGAHLANVIGTLLKLYSNSDQTYKSKSYADADKVITIDQPCVSFYGCCVPTSLTDALSQKDINSGLLSRMLIFDIGDHFPRPSEPAKLPVPPEVIEWLQAWNRVSPTPNPMHLIGGDSAINPRVVYVSKEAFDISQEFLEEVHLMTLAAQPRGKDALYGRAHQNALKFALIRACAALPVRTEAGIRIDESALSVDGPTMRWAVELSRVTVQHMDKTTDEIADTGYEQQLNALRKFIKSSGARGATQRDIGKTRAGMLPERTLNDLLVTLSKAGDIQHVTIKTKGRPREAFVHKMYYDVHNIADDGEDE